MENINNLMDNLADMEDMPDFDVEDTATEQKEETTTQCDVVRFNSTRDIVVRLQDKQMNEGWDMRRCVEYYLEWMADGDRVFAERMAQGEKSIEQCLEYINIKARETIKGGSGVVSDGVVYGWSVHYYTETNEALGLNKKEQTPKPTAPTTKTTAKNAPKKDTKAESKAKTYTNPLLASKGKESVKKADTNKTANVVPFPTMNGLTKKQLMNNEDCGFLF